MHNVDGKRVECKLATPKETKQKKSKKSVSTKKSSNESIGCDNKSLWKLFVGGLPKTASEDDLQAYFS